MFDTKLNEFCTKTLHSAGDVRCIVETTEYVCVCRCVHMCVLERVCNVKGAKANTKIPKNTNIKNCMCTCTVNMHIGSCHRLLHFMPPQSLLSVSLSLPPPHSHSLHLRCRDYKILYQAYYVNENIFIICLMCCCCNKPTRGNRKTVWLSGKAFAIVLP